MELWLLGGGAVVLIALTLWIVWPAETVESINDAFRDEEDMLMTPQGDEFEDQYTSATADLSAGGVATAIDAMQEEAGAGPAEPTQDGEPSAYGEPSQYAAPMPYAAAGESWSSPSIAREGATDVALTPAPAGAWPDAPPAWPEPQATRRLARPRTIGLGAGLVLAIGGAIFGAWLYARWQRRRNTPVNRARRGLHHAQKELNSSLRDAQKELSASMRHAQKDLNSSLRDAQKQLRSSARDARKELSSSRFAGAVRA